MIGINEEAKVGDMLLDNLNVNLAGVYSFAEELSKKLKPYAEAMEVIERNVRVALESVAEKIKPVRAFYILGEHQFTYWKPLSPDEVESIIDSNNVDEYLKEKINDKHFIDYTELYDKMVHSDLLSDTNNAVLKQAISAMDMDLYDLALIGLVVIFDGVLTVATNNTTPSIQKRLDEISLRLEGLSEEEWESLDESDITIFGMHITWTQTMNEFQKNSNFAAPETEPKDLNRHWIAHGRKTSGATKLDCCKMINALYGLMYFGNAI